MSKTQQQGSSRKREMPPKEAMNLYPIFPMLTIYTENRFTKENCIKTSKYNFS